MQALPFYAISTGYRVERDVREPVMLSVHSRFRHALNLLAPDGGLVTLLAGSGSHFPTGIRVALPANWDWRREACDGMAVVHGGGGLWTGAWRIELRHAATWRPRTLQGALGLDAQWRLAVLHQRAARQLRAHAAAQAFCGHQLALLPQCPAGARPVSISPHDEPRTIEREVRALIGYGTGLTPEGDDYLLGYLAALWPWRVEHAVRTHREAIATAVARHLHATTDISRHYLQLGVQGHFSEPIVALLHTFAGSSGDACLPSCVDAVLQFGASSGADTLAGILHGVRTLQTLACAAHATSRHCDGAPGNHHSDPRIRP